MVIKFIYYFWAIFLLIVPIFVSIIIFVIIKHKLSILNKSNAKSTFIIGVLGFFVGAVFFTWNFYDSCKLMFTAKEMEIDEDNRLFIYNMNELPLSEIDISQEEIGNNLEKEEDFEILNLQYSDNIIKTVAETYIYRK